MINKQDEGEASMVENQNQNNNNPQQPRKRILMVKLLPLQPLSV